jgi:hypothetical protein
MGRLRIARHLVLIALASTATARTFHSIFERASSCPDTTYSPCNATGLPSNFCCPSTATCIPLAANTTLLCCPTGSDCNQIQPITCDISQQNVTLHPNNPLKTSALSTSLPTCGSLCCPFGYSCTTGNVCLKDANQNVAPGTLASTSTASSSSPSATKSSTLSSSTPKPTTVSTPAPLNGNTTLTENCNKFPVGAVLVGFFPGLVFGILLSIASICIFGAQRRRASRRRSGSSFGNISEPQPSEHVRTDFLRKQPQTPSSTAGSTPARQGTIHRVRSLFRKSQLDPNNTMVESPRAPMPLVINKAGQNQYPVTPPLQRERSYEDVNIFADRDTASSLRENQRNNGGLQPGKVEARASHQTTMDDVMGLAGLPKGQRELPDPVVMRLRI